jgi:hypothetical protein
VRLTLPHSQNDALILTDSAALHHILVSQAYNFIKPILNASAIGELSGPGLIVVEGMLPLSAIIVVFLC